MAPTPVMAGTAGALMTIERKLAYARDRLARGDCSEESAGWYRREVEAFVQALHALRYHRLTLTDDQGPVALLSGVVEAYRSDDEAALRTAVRRIELALSDLDGA